MAVGNAQPTRRDVLVWLKTQKRRNHDAHHADCVFYFGLRDSPPQNRPWKHHTSSLLATATMRTETDNAWNIVDGMRGCVWATARENKPASHNAASLQDAK